MSLFIAIVLLVVGLALLVGGADLLVRGVSALAAAIGVSPLIIGMTVVAFGTSTPEIVVNTLSAIGGETGLAFGNVVGANCINIGFVLALVAIIRPLDVQNTVVLREIPMMLLAMTAALVMSEDTILRGAPAAVLDRGDGLMLLLLFCVFLYYTIVEATSHRGSDAFMKELGEEAPAAGVKRSLWYDALFVLLGLIGVGVGGRMTVNGAVGLAQAAGVPENIIGLTIISFGTTLPELTTSLLAARRGHADIAIGNVVGSCIFNLLCIGGIVATIEPIIIPAGGRLDLLMMLGLGLALFPMALPPPGRINRLEGSLLLIAYLTYVIYRSATAIGG